MKKLLMLAMLATATPAVAQPTPSTAIAPLGPNSALLSLTAEGKSRRVPDLALFSAGVVTQATTAAAALTENNQRISRVVAALKRAGIADRDIQTSNISLQPRYSNPDLEAQVRARQTGQPYIPADQPARIIGYEARNTVNVRVRRLSEMGSIIDTLIQAGANQVDGPNFTLDEPRAAQDEARLEAVTVGRQRAELYARAAGMRVARIVSISESQGYYPVQQAIMVTGARMGAPPAPPPAPERDSISPGELELGVNVSMQFELVR